MEDIKAWLHSDGLYADGLVLYLRYGTNEFLKKRFQSRDEYSKKKLAEELEKLIVTPSIPSQAKRKSDSPQINSEADHLKYLSLLKKRDEVVKQIERNMSVLDLSTAKDVVFETAKQVLKLHKRKTELWAVIDFYQDHGCFEQPALPKQISKEKEIQLLYQAISKADKRLQNDNCRNKIKTQELRNKHILRLKYLKSL